MSDYSYNNALDTITTLRATIAVQAARIAVYERNVESYEHNAAQYRERIAALTAEKADYATTVSKVWAALGIASMDEANGKTIWELVAALTADLEHVKAELTRWRQEATELAQGRMNAEKRIRQQEEVIALNVREYNKLKAKLDEIPGWEW